MMNPFKGIYLKIAAAFLFLVGLWATYREVKQTGKNEQLVKNQAEELIEDDRTKQAAQNNKKIRERVSAMSSEQRIAELLRDKTD